VRRRLAGVVGVPIGWAVTPSPRAGERGLRRGGRGVGPRPRARDGGAVQRARSGHSGPTTRTPSAGIERPTRLRS